tara:strand:- start:240 stop:1184 length:945 start_codon:yes stop_codon:yes gene_type:complete
MFRSKNSQLLLVKFPIIFPILYGLVLFFFPAYETYLILITILILAETHFGATWPFFINKINYPYLKEKRIELIIVPVIISILSLVGFIYVKSFFLLIFLAANMYHVTRQSFGVCKLYCSNSIEFKFQTNFIYITNFTLFLITLFRFYYPLIKAEHLIILNIIFLSLILIISVFYIKKFNFSENYLTFLTGCIIFYPACFVDNPVHIILMGVTMHYTQYLYLTSYVHKSRNEIINNNETSIKKSIYSFLSIIVIYSLIMTFFSTMGKSNDNFYKELIIIPILGQMLHFYIDSQVWKFSEKHNRDNVLHHLKKIIN